MFHLSDLANNCYYYYFFFDISLQSPKIGSQWSELNEYTIVVIRLKK